MLPLLLNLALAVGPPPCEPVSEPSWIEGEHFWIEWDASVCDAENAQQMLDWSEQARTAYLNAGWPITDQTILIRVRQSIGSAGLATTTECDDGTQVPLITLFADQVGDPGENTTKHEVVHAVQYAFMGTYTDAVASWPWWLEGCAVWLTMVADDNRLEWAGRSRAYLDSPWLGLHQDITAYADPSRSRFLYGTGFLAQFLEDRNGHEAVQSTWTYGATATGNPIYFPDAIEASGIEWEPFWREYMAALTVLDTPHATYFSEPVFVEERVGSLPASGSPDSERRPGGLGVSVVHIRKGAGVVGRDLEVEFDGDPEVDWMAVLVRTRGKNRDGTVEEIVPMDIRGGNGRAILGDFDGSREAWLVVSPQTLDLQGRDFTWSARLADLPGDEEPGGCSCMTSQPPLSWALVLPLAAAVARRRR